jgi:hypothetical protein
MAAPDRPMRSRSRGSPRRRGHRPVRVGGERWQSPVLDSAGVLLKHMYMTMSLRVSTPPVTNRSAVPVVSSLTAVATAARELAQAASVV